MKQQNVKDIPLGEVKLPPLPDRLVLKSGESVPVQQFSDTQLKLIAAKWAHQWLDYARAKRATGKTGRIRKRRGLTVLEKYTDAPAPNQKEGE